MERRESMSKKFAIISLSVLAVIGSLVTFYASNMFFSDVSNFGAGFSKTTLFASLSMMLFGAMLITTPLYVLRLYQRPNTKKRLTRTYSIIAAALALFGLIFTVLAGVINYHSFVKPYPFPGYIIIMLIIHLCVLAGAVFAFVKYVRPMPEDTETFKVKPLYALHTFGLYLLIALAFNRFGAFLLMPVYVQWSSLYMTFTYFLFMLIPMALLVIKTLKILEIGKSYFVPVVAVAALNIVLFAITMIIGANDSAFVSAVSAAAPLERLGSMPMEILIHFVAYLGVSIYYVILEVRANKAAK